jgi:hypothetical protein
MEIILLLFLQNLLTAMFYYSLYFVLKTNSAGIKNKIEKVSCFLMGLVITITYLTLLFKYYQYEWFGIEKVVLWIFLTNLSIYYYGNKIRLINKR